MTKTTNGSSKIAGAKRLTLFFAGVLLLLAGGSALQARARKQPAVRRQPAARRSPAEKVHKPKKVKAPKKSKVRAQMAPTPARISEIQSALADQGSYSSGPNGRWDDATMDAMRKFQSAHGLNPSGKIDALSLQKLGLGSEVAGRAAPIPAQQQPRASAAGATDPQSAQNP